MNPDTPLPIRIGICALLLSAVALADQYGPQTFAVANGTTSLGDGTTLAGSDGIASVQDGALQLTRAGTSDTSSSFRIPPLSNSSQGWNATFEFLLADNPGGSNPADGFSFNYGAIPRYNPSQSDESASDAHGGGEEGWHPSVAHISFEVDTWDNGGGEDGLNIAISGEDIAFENQTVLRNGQSISKWSNILYVGQIAEKDIQVFEKNRSLQDKVRRAIDRSRDIQFQNEIFSITKVR